MGAGDTPRGVAVSPDGMSAYVTNQDSDSISQYDVLPGGRLTPKSPPTVAAGDGPQQLAVRLNGTNVYVTNYTRRRLPIQRRGGRDVVPHEPGHSGCGSRSARDSDEPSSYPLRPQAEAAERGLRE